MNLNSLDYITKKVIVVGDSGVGKSCLLHQFAEGTFTDSYNGTVGADFTMKTLQVDDKRIKLQVWDTAGQERFRSLTTFYYHGADAVIIVYDIAQKESFDTVSSWLQDVQSYANENVLKLVVGNKSDLTDKRAVTKEHAEELCSRVGCQHIETSAKDATNVNELFIIIARQLIQIHTDDSTGSNSAKLDLRAPQPARMRNRSCC